MSELITIPRKIYFKKSTGEFVLDTGENTGANLRQTTIDEDFELYSELQKYNLDAIDVVILEVGQYYEEFNTCIGFRINPENKEIEFTFSDKNVEHVVYEKPYKEQIDMLNNRIAELEQTISEIINLIPSKE